MGKTAALILAAGHGTRFGGEIPKQFLELSGKPLWQLSTEAFFPFADAIMIVTDKVHKDQVAAKVMKWTSGQFWDEAERPHLFVTEGGDSRAESVLNGLRFLERISENESGDELPETVLIHDAARCLVTPEVIRECLMEAKLHGASVAAIPATDTVKVAKAGEEGFPAVLHTPDRRTLYQVQTPQGFSFEWILSAYTKAEEAGELGSLTDDASAVERFSEHTVVLTPGSVENIKVTRPLDLAFAECILRHRISK